MLAGVVAFVAAAYGGVSVGRSQRAAVTLIACGAVALGVVVVASITFEIANPGPAPVIGSDLRLGPGAMAAALSAVVILDGGLLTRRHGETFEDRMHPSWTRIPGRFMSP